MRTRTELILSNIAITAEYLKAFRPIVVSKEPVQIPSTMADLSSVCGPVAFDVIDVKEMPVSFTTTSASTAVCVYHLLPEFLCSFGSFLKTIRTVFFGT